MSVLVCKADQLAYITKAQAKEATDFLKEQKQVVLWCACCKNDKKELINIQNVDYTHTGHENFYQIYITDDQGKTHDIDLAYVHYILGQKAYCVGKMLGYTCDPCTEAFMYNEKVKSNADILREKSEAMTFFSQYTDINSFHNFISQSLPTLDDCKLIFKNNGDAYSYQGMIENTKDNIVTNSFKNQDISDIKIETFTTEDIKKGKGNYSGGMKDIVDKLQPNITFYKVSLLETGNEYGTSYKYWIKIDDRWVFFPKLWRPFERQTPIIEKGTLNLINYDVDPFDVYIDGNFVGSISGSSTQSFTLPQGKHSVRVVEKSGYILKQQIENWNIAIQGNSISTLSWD